jgi:hypothetical protein
MKSALMLATTVVLSLTIVLGAPAGLAQVEPDATDAPPADQMAPPEGCPPMPDMLTDEQMAAQAEGQPACPGTAAEPTDAAPPAVDAAPVEAVPPPQPDPGPPPVEVVPPPPPVDTAPPPPVEVAPTATPTPLPAPTATPTPTSAARTVPAGTLSRQLPFANPGDNFCDILLDSTDQPACPAQTFPAVFSIQVSPWSNTVPVTFQVDNRPPRTTSNISFDVLFTPDAIPAGNHTVTVSETIQNQKLSAKLQLHVLKATSPHYLVYPRTVTPGAHAQIYVAGFPPNTEQPLGIYRERQDCNTFGQGNECFELVRELGTLKINSDGMASRDFTVGINDQRTAYLVATPDLKVRGNDVSEALRAYGQPWFVVGQP